MSVECYRLNAAKKGEFQHYANSITDEQFCKVELTSVDLSFPIDLLYEDIDLREEDLKNESSEEIFKFINS